MSIVADALRKIQSKRSGDTVFPEISGMEVLSDSRYLKEPVVKKEKRAAGQGIVIFALSLLVTFIVIYSYTRWMPHRAVPPEKGVIEEMEQVGPAAMIDERKIEEERSVTMPERPTVYSLMAAPELNGIMYDRSDPKAVINGRIARKGTVISGYTVTEILPDMVKIKISDREVILRLE